MGVLNGVLREAVWVKRGGGGRREGRTWPRKDKGEQVKRMLRTCGYERD